MELYAPSIKWVFLEILVMHKRYNDLVLTCSHDSKQHLRTFLGISVTGDVVMIMILTFYDFDLS